MSGPQSAFLDQANIQPMASTIRSPFEPVLRPDLDRLPQQFRDQYLVRSDDPERAVLSGIMHRVWHQPGWVWPILRLLAVFDIIFPEQGSDVAADMIIEGAEGPSGRAAQVWRRSFAFSSPRRFDAMMTFDAHQGRVVEWLRPRNLIEVVWDVAFEPPATIRITANRVRIGRGRWRFTLPKWAGPDVSAVEKADADSYITIDLVVRHPWLGDVFGYTGRFHVRREQKHRDST